MRYLYVNSSANPRNPNNPPKRVTFGQASSSEMGSLWLQVLPRTRGDLEILDRSFSPKLLQDDIAGDEKMLEAAPDNPLLHAALASCYLEAGRDADAATQLEAALVLDPSYIRHYELGKALLRQKKLVPARDHLAEAVRMKPDFLEGINDLAIAYHVSGQLDEAVRWYERALQVRPAYAEAHYNLARALAALDRRDEALAHYRRAVELRPDDAEFHSTFATLLASSNRVDEAVAHFRRALQLQPDLPAALVDLAWLLATSERSDVRAPEEAVRLATRAADVTNRQNATVLDTLAAAYAAGGRLEDAITTARAALALASRDGDGALAARIAQRLAFYEQSRR
jgi:tetratricopeptide (TPR) repeat protein